MHRSSMRFLLLLFASAPPQAFVGASAVDTLSSFGATEVAATAKDSATEAYFETSVVLGTVVYAVPTARSVM